MLIHKKLQILILFLKWARHPILFQQTLLDTPHPGKLVPGERLDKEQIVQPIYDVVGKALKS